MPQNVIGIDIGSYSIKIAELERTFQKYEFVNFFERKVQFNELLKPEESITVTLQGMLDDFGLKWDQVICGYPGHKVSSRLVTLPFGNLKKIDQTIEFELENYVPFDLETLVIDYHVLSATKEQSEILVFYTLKDEFSKYLNLLQNCKVDPKIITAEGVELLNLVVSGMVPPESPYAILDLGHTKTNLTLRRGKKLQSVRSISIGGQQFTEAIQKNLKMERGGILLEGEVIWTIFPNRWAWR